MTFSVAHWDTWDDSYAFQNTRGENLLSILMESVMCLQLRRAEENVLEILIVKCHLCTLYSPCRLGIHLITLSNILMPRYK